MCPLDNHSAGRQSGGVAKERGSKVGESWFTKASVSFRKAALLAPGSGDSPIQTNWKVLDLGCPSGRGGKEDAMAIQQVLTEKEVADLLRCTRAALKKWRRRGLGPRYSRIGRMVRYHTRDIEMFLEQHAVDPSAARETQDLPSGESGMPASGRVLMN